MGVIIPPKECLAEGCTENDRNRFYCSGCENEDIPWLEVENISNETKS